MCLLVSIWVRVLQHSEKMVSEGCGWGCEHIINSGHSHLHQKQSEPSSFSLVLMLDVYIMDNEDYRSPGTEYYIIYKVVYDTFLPLKQHHCLRTETRRSAGLWAKACLSPSRNFSLIFGFIVTINQLYITPSPASTPKQWQNEDKEMPASVPSPNVCACVQMRDSVLLRSKQSAWLHRRDILIRMAILENTGAAIWWLCSWKH